MRHILVTILFNFFDKLNSLYRVVKVKYLINNNSKDRIYIHSSFQCGDGSDILIKSQSVRIRILQGVVLRRFCTVYLYKSGELMIGENVFFNNYCSVNCLGQIEIGNNTLFGEGVKIYDHNHSYRAIEDLLKIERDDFTIGKVKIGNNCWIGSNVTILNNVEIGDNVIIGAGCLIYKSIPSNMIVKLSQETTSTSI